MEKYDVIIMCFVLIKNINNSNHKKKRSTNIKYVSLLKWVLIEEKCLSLRWRRRETQLEQSHWHYLYVSDQKHCSFAYYILLLP